MKEIESIKVFNDREEVIFDSEREIKIVVSESDQFASPFFADAIYTERKLFDDFQREHNVSLVEILKWWKEEENLSREDFLRAVEIAIME